MRGRVFVLRLHSVDWNGARETSARQFAMLSSSRVSCSAMKGLRGPSRMSQSQSQSSRIQQGCVSVPTAFSSGPSGHIFKVASMSISSQSRL